MATNEITKAPSKSGSVPSLSGRFEDLQHDMNRLFDQFFHRDSFRSLGWPMRLKDYDLNPTVDVTERPETYEVTAELPGVDEKDIKVSVENGILSIAGEKKSEKTEDAKDVHVSERHYGSFLRSFALPDDADESTISADYKKGVLKVSVGRSKKPKSSARHIEIKAA